MYHQGRRSGAPSAPGDRTYLAGRTQPSVFRQHRWFRPRSTRGPCGDGPTGWSGRHGSACAAGIHASCVGDGCWADRCASTSRTPWWGLGRSPGGHIDAVSPTPHRDGTVASGRKACITQMVRHPDSVRPAAPVGVCRRTEVSSPPATGTTDTPQVVSFRYLRGLAATHGAGLVSSGYPQPHRAGPHINRERIR